MPPPLPVSLRLEAEPWHALPKQLILDLRNRLTNSGERGDLTDVGANAGSLMRELIDDYNIGVANATDWWVITVWPQGSQHRGPVAWCLLRPEPSRYAPTFRIAVYTSPAWRKRGLGALLVNEATRLSHRLGIGRITASPWNGRSDTFFKSAGFQLVCARSEGMSALAELDVPSECPARLPWRCRPPEV